MLNTKKIDKALDTLKKTSIKDYMLLYLYVNCPYIKITRMVKMTKEDVLTNIMPCNNKKIVLIPDNIREKLKEYIKYIKSKYLFPSDSDKNKTITTHYVYAKLKEIETKFKINNLRNLDTRKQNLFDEMMENFEV